MFNRKSLLWLLVITVILTGCGSEASKNADGGTEAEKEAYWLPWITACESDYKSDDCKKENLKSLRPFLKNSEVNLFARINPYEDYENSSECLTDPKGNSCTTLLALSDSQVADLKCEGVEAFGSGYFCWVEILVSNIGSTPIDDYIRASLYDVEGIEFAADVEGSFDVGVRPLDLSREARVQLNPEKSAFIAFGFSVPDIERQFTRIFLGGNDYSNNYEIKLCRKNSGDIDNQFNRIADKALVIYEDAALLNSCRYDFESGKFTNRLDGSVS